MEVLDERVLEGFGISPKYIRKIKYMYVVRCDRGTFIIRKTEAAAERILFCHNVKNMIKRKGFVMFDSFETSVLGEPYFEFDGANYVMARAGREGQNPDYCLSADVREIMRAYGSFHRAACFGRCDEFDGFYSGGKEKYFDDLLKKLKRMKRLVGKKKRQEDIDYVFIKNYDYYLRLCEESLSGLSKYELEKEEKRALEEGRIVINSADEEEMVKYPEGVYMRSLLGLGVSAQIEDLRLIINRYLKKNLKPALGAGEIIKEYRGRNPLEKRELELLYYLLMFPERYIKTYWDYYKKGHVFTPVYVKEGINRIVSEKENNFEYIGELKEL